MSYQEKMVLAHFVVLTLLWVLRKPLVIPGWGDLFEPGFVTDSTTVIAVTIALFVAPARAPNFGAVGGSGSDSQRPPVPRCLDWGAASSAPWGIIRLLLCNLQGSNGALLTQPALGAVASLESSREWTSRRTVLLRCSKSNHWPGVGLYRTQSQPRADGV